MATKKPQRQEWIALIEDYKSSGLTMAAWCSSNQFTLHTLKYWLRKLKGTSSAIPGLAKSRRSTFVPLAVDDSASKVPGTPLVVSVGEVRIEIQSGFDPRLLQEVVKALTVSC